MTALIDSDAIDALVALRRPGKPDLVARVVGLFHEETPRLLQAIQDGLDEGDMESVRVAAHTLKSSSAYVGAREFAETCSRVERSARDGNLVDCLLAADGLADLYERSVTALADALPRAA